MNKNFRFLRIIVLSLFVYCLIWVVPYFLGLTGHLDLLANNTFLLIHNLIFLAISMGLYFGSRQSTDGHISKYSKISGVFWVMVAFVLVVVANYYIREITEPLYGKYIVSTGHRPLSSGPEVLMNNSLWMSAFNLILHGPISEELLFRGWLTDQWRKILNSSSALIVVAILFAAFHVGPMQTSNDYTHFLLIEFPGLLLIGLSSGIVRLRFSIVHAVVLHALINSIPLIFMIGG